MNTAFQSSSASAFIFLSSDFPLRLRYLLASSHYHQQSLFDYSSLSSIFSLSKSQRGNLEYVLALLFFLIPCWSHIVFRFCSKWVASKTHLEQGDRYPAIYVSELWIIAASEIIHLLPFTGKCSFESCPSQVHIGCLTVEPFFESSKGSLGVTWPLPSLSRASF